MVAVQARSVDEQLRRRSAFPYQRIALVSHGDPIRGALSYFLGAPLDLFERIETSIRSVSVITLFENAPQIHRLNDVPRVEDAR